ncbi:2-keto-4-pentenoate hydratase [Massarina eburnea CBS 473.64]|uniref:2-keto-4-pentenoate hydratase n=1 Tax=Massarina eburnea CBS 473.64 TaxID=1395130 RepID=A0A6A6RP21_9PLEO|nr:2-keto-4-pentenoate hydratase [Massarina eburnea CBS 473.64]
MTNYVSYIDPQTSTPRIGHYNLSTKAIQPLSFISGTPINSLYQVIEAGSHNIKPTASPPILAASTKILPPLTGRDVLCVGKNYAEHAKEFNQSGFDKSDTLDQPTHPVIFTKRFTSIIADREEILRHEGWTETLDYEGEIGVIVGKKGWKIEEKDAWNHVWGFTIVNDVTARERQKDHKQFFLGKSADTFCPMGPIAVPKEDLEKVLRVQTHVNGELRQNATIEDLIFSIPYLIKTISEGQMLMPGDVLATGTPAGVGIGRKPPIYLQPGDEISISITGLGTLTNRIASPDAPNPTPQPITHISSQLKPTNEGKTPTSSILTTINDKPLYYTSLGPSAPESHIVFIHGLGNTHTFFTPLINALNLSSTHTCHLLDLEGAGLSPTHPLSKISITSYTQDLTALFAHANIPPGATIIAHSTACLIALSFTLAHPESVARLILLAPSPFPIPHDTEQLYYDRAELARTRGMSAIADTIAPLTSTSTKPPLQTVLAEAMLRTSLLGQDPEGYAKGCTALAESGRMRFELGDVRARTLIVAGGGESGGVAEGWAGRIGGAEVRGLEGWGDLVGWVGLEGVVQVVGGFLVGG